MSKAILILGSEVDASHAEKITAYFDQVDIEYESYIASAHKNPEKVLKVLKDYEKKKKIVYITIAGRSNALSGFCAGNTAHPVIACPPFADKIDMMVNINSTLQMPSNVPVMTVLDPRNAGLAAERILNN